MLLAALPRPCTSHHAGGALPFSTTTAGLRWAAQLLRQRRARAFVRRGRVVYRRQPKVPVPLPAGGLLAAQAACWVCCLLRGDPKRPALQCPACRREPLLLTVASMLLLWCQVAMLGLPLRVRAEIRPGLATRKMAGSGLTAGTVTHQTVVPCPRRTAGAGPHARPRTRPSAQTSATVRVLGCHEARAGRRCCCCCCRRHRLQPRDCCNCVPSPVKITALPKTEPVTPLPRPPPPPPHTHPVQDVAIGSRRSRQSGLICV